MPKTASPEAMRASGGPFRRVNPSANSGGGIVKDRKVMIFLMVLVTILLLILFFGVTIAGGRAHTRANEETARKLAARQASAADAEHASER